MCAVGRDRDGALGDVGKCRGRVVSKRIVAGIRPAERQAGDGDRLARAGVLVGKGAAEAVA